VYGVSCNIDSFPHNQGTSLSKSCTLAQALGPISILVGQRYNLWIAIYLRIVASLHVNVNLQQILMDKLTIFYHIHVFLFTCNKQNTHQGTSLSKSCTLAQALGPISILVVSI
jgi:hypothetical protein